MNICDANVSRTVSRLDNRFGYSKRIIQIHPVGLKIDPVTRHVRAEGLDQDVAASIMVLRR